MPAVYQFPPHQPHPFIEVNFRPLAMLPPGCAELLRIGSWGYKNLVPPKFVLKDAARAPCVVIGGHHKYAMGAGMPQTPGNILSFGLSRKTDDGTYFNRLVLRRLLHISFCDIDQVLIIDNVIRGDIEKHFGSVFLR